MMIDSIPSSSFRSLPETCIELYFFMKSHRVQQLSLTDIQKCKDIFKQFDSLSIEEKKLLLHSSPKISVVESEAISKLNEHNHSWKTASDALLSNPFTPTDIFSSILEEQVMDDETSLKEKLLSWTEDNISFGTIKKSYRTKENDDTMLIKEPISEYPLPMNHEDMDLSKTAILKTLRKDELKLNNELHENELNEQWLKWKICLQNAL